MGKRVFTADFYRGENYSLYFRTAHWLKLNDQLIDSNSRAKCWICEKPYNLLIHHEKYDNLFNERLYRDIFILCFNCHTQLHFYHFLFIFERKTSLTYRVLKRRRLWLKAKYNVRNRKYWSIPWYILRYSLAT